MAAATHAKKTRSKGQRSRTHSHEKYHGHMLLVKCAAGVSIELHVNRTVQVSRSEMLSKIINCG